MIDTFKAKLAGFISSLLKNSMNVYIDEEYSMSNMLKKEARLQSLEYVKLQGDNILIFSDRLANVNYAVDKALQYRTNEVDYFLEFGVWKGVSFKLIAQKIGNARCFGFDSFEGLKEDWVGTGMAKGFFNVNKRTPEMKTSNHKFYVGYFDETLPQFMAELKSSNVKQLLYIHIDSDTYPAAKLVLDTLSPYIGKNTIITFDEYFGYHGWKVGEYKAFQEFAKEKNIRYEYLSFASDQATIRIC